MNWGFIPKTDDKYYKIYNPFNPQPFIIPMIQFTKSALLGSFLALSMISVNAFAQDEAKKEGYKFTPVKVLEISPVQDQAMTGTCWSFSGTGFLDSEVYRLTGKRVLLSPLYSVAQGYKDKARAYVRYQGHNNFGQGGSFYDVLAVLESRGVVPFEEYTGLLAGQTRYNHNELEALAKGYLDTIVKEMMKANHRSPSWAEGFDGIIDSYLGKMPETFKFDGKEFTPASFAEYLKLDADNYVSITSFSHHPFYRAFVLEIPDNWRHSVSYNLPVDEMMQVIDNAIAGGFTVAWGTDVSEDGFTRDGYAVLPDIEAATSTRGSDMEKWIGASAGERRMLTAKLIQDPKTPEIKVTQEYRQRGFDDLSTTDDHGMLIYGTAKDQYGKPFYMVKNSWGTSIGYDGIWYASKPFVAGKTISITVHKDAIPKALRTKLGL